MEDRIKAAYRHLLYVAMLRFRTLCNWQGAASKNPLQWHRIYQESRKVAATANWLHNLAVYSARDFAGFEEFYFWRHHGDLCQQFPNWDLERYREIFDEYLDGRDYCC